MRRHFVLSLLAMAALLMGADCDGSSGSSGSGGSGLSAAAAASDGGPILVPIDGETPGDGGDSPYDGDRSDHPGSVVPEPSAALIFGTGLLVAYAAQRRRK
ncbi:MAG: PEP-CTERM sorting domain-containing protein [Myxococcota bacterium]